MTLTGAANESVGGWTLGFIQLKYLSIDQARYRGATNRDGSMLTTLDNKTLCRDTYPNSTDVWYYPSNQGFTSGQFEQTRMLSAFEYLPPTGSLDVRAQFADRTSRWWPTTQINTLVPGHPTNFLHYAYIELFFCTMLAAKDPNGNFRILKHFYWNVIWEQYFKSNNSSPFGSSTTLQPVVPDPAKRARLEQNTSPVRDGYPRDSRFPSFHPSLAGIRSLPISRVVTTHAQPKISYAPDWRHS